MEGLLDCFGEYVLAVAISEGRWKGEDEFDGLNRYDTPKVSESPATCVEDSCGRENEDCQSGTVIFLSFGGRRGNFEASDSEPNLSDNKLQLSQQLETRGL